MYMANHVSVCFFGIIDEEKDTLYAMTTVWMMRDLNLGCSNVETDIYVGIYMKQ